MSLSLYTCICIYIYIYIHNQTISAHHPHIIKQQERTQSARIILIISIYLSIHPSIYVSLSLYIYVHIHVCVYTYIYIYICIYTYTYITGCCPSGAVGALRHQRDRLGHCVDICLLAIVYERTQQLVGCRRRCIVFSDCPSPA